MLAMLSSLLIQGATCYADTPLGSAWADGPVARFSGLAIDRHQFEGLHPTAGANFPMRCQTTVTLSACGEDVAVFSTPVHTWQVVVGPWDGTLDYAGSSGATLVHVTAFGGEVPVPERCPAVYARCTSDLEFAPGIGAWALASRMRVSGRLVVD